MSEKDRQAAAYQAGYDLGLIPKSYPHPVPAEHAEHVQDFVLGWKQRMVEEVSNEFKLARGKVMPNPIVRVTTKRIWETFHHHATGEMILLPPGEYALELVNMPAWVKGNRSCLWFVIKDGEFKDVGSSVGFWLDWQNGTLADREGHPNFGKPIDWQDFEIEVFINGRKLDGSFENIYQTGHAWHPVR